LITSLSNIQIKQIRKLREKKYRIESGLFFLEGIRIVIEALQTSGVVEQLIICRDLINGDKALEAVADAQEKHISILEVNTDVFKSLSGKDGPQGVAAVARQRWSGVEELQDSVDGIWIALYQVADPGNLGTILRTLDGMGGKGIILLDNCTDPYDPSAIRASMGAIFTKKIIKLSSNDFISWIQKNNIKVVGTSDAARKEFRSYRYNKDMVLLMGSEREGLPEKLVDICDEVVSIPMVGKADSLNLAVASSIMLYEIAAQQWK
jgi:TrmH family RNA methyltransferase